jgi:hypothetical protein
MSDIVERLRTSITKGHEPTDELAIEAAAEIERLQVLLTEAINLLHHFGHKQNASAIRRALGEKIAAMIIALSIVLASCTTARQPPWIIEQPLHYAPPEPAPAGPKLPPARQERRV